MSNCLPFCEYVRYFLLPYYPYKLIPEAENVSCAAEIEIGMASFQYIQHAEIFNNGFYNVAASLGGIMLLWLGIDFILLMEWILLLKDMLIAVYQLLIKPRRKPITMKSIERNQGISEPIMELRSV